MCAHDCLFSSELCSGLHRGSAPQGTRSVRGEQWEKDTQGQGLGKARLMDLSQVDVLAYTGVMGTDKSLFCDIYTDVPTFLAWMMGIMGQGGSWGGPKDAESIL